MTEVHHLILSDHEVTLVSEAGRTLAALAMLADSTGINAERLTEQSEVLRALQWRLQAGSPIRLTPEPETVEA